MKKYVCRKMLICAFLVAALSGCAEPNSPASSTPGRWYSLAQAEQGRVLFQSHCAVCHGAAAEGTPTWFERDANGQFPPPPLDDTAHAWHHTRDNLQTVIREGGVPFGGVMPAFGTTLTDEETLTVIAFFQRTWSDEIYERWAKIDEAR